MRAALATVSHRWTMWLLERRQREVLVGLRYVAKQRQELQITEDYLRARHGRQAIELIQLQQRGKSC